MARYTTEQKEAVINRAREIGAAAAAKTEGVSYPTVLKWMKESVAAAAEKIVSLPADTISSIDGQIEQTEKEIEELNADLAKKKAALKALKKAREKAEKAERKAVEAAEKKELVETILKSGRPVEEILSLLQS
jgi:transposase-like protein